MEIGPCLNSRCGSGRSATPQLASRCCGGDRCQRGLVFLPFQWKENVTLTENQVQALALSRQASQELDVKRREAIYNDVLTKQQMVNVYKLLDRLSVLERGVEYDFACVCSQSRSVCLGARTGPYRRCLGLCSGECDVASGDGGLRGALVALLSLFDGDSVGCSFKKCTYQIFL